MHITTCVVTIYEAFFDEYGGPYKDKNHFGLDIYY